MQTEQQHKPRRAHALRVLALSVIAVLVIWLLAWLAVPPLLKSQAEQRLGALLGRQVQVGELQFSPWALSLTVRDLRIAGAGGAADQLRIARLHANLSTSSVWQRAPVVEALEIEQPVLRLARLPGGGLDIDDLVARLRPAPDAPATEPARFALYNLQLTGGQVLVDDQVAGQQHAVRALQLGLPFLSNLPAHVQVHVEPRLAFELEGSRFDTGAQVQPFAATRQGQLRLQWQDLDLARWAPYLPASVPLRPAAGRLSASWLISFQLPADTQQPPQLAITGEATLQDLSLVPSAGAAPLLGWQRLQLSVARLQPLARQAALGDLRIDGLRLALARDAQGRLNLQQLAGGAASAPAASASAQPAPDPWQFSLQSLTLADASIDWQDATARPAARLALSDLQLKAGPLDSRPGATAPLQWSARLGPPGVAAPAETSGQGQVGPAAAQLAFELKGLQAGWLSAYLAQHLALPLQARATVAGRLDWAAGDSPRLQAELDQLRIDDLRLGAGSGAPLAWRSLAVAQGRIDLMARRLQMGSLTLEQPQLSLRRGADGVVGWSPSSLAIVTPREGAQSTGPAQRALNPQPGRRAAEAHNQAVASTGAAQATSGGDWQLALNALQVNGGRLQWADAAAPAPVALGLSDLRLTAAGLRWPSDGRTAPARVTLDTRIRDERPQAEGRRAPPPGRLNWQGQLRPQPVMASGQWRLDRLPAHALAPYVATGLQLVLAHADVGGQGRMAVEQRAAGFSVQAEGDALLSDVQVQARPAEAGREGEDLLTWQALKLAGLSVRSAPGEAPKVTVGEAALADFYSRLVITEQGRFNLRDVTAPSAPAAPTTASPAAAAPAEAGVSAPTGGAATASAAGADASQGADPSTAAAASPGPVIVIGRTQLTRGRIDFTDRFVKPNYSAALSELNGSLGTLRTDSPQMAPISLQGRVSGTGLLDISGELNPLAKPLALNIRARASDIELAALSPYSGRYAGYAIERGKLSMDVAYQVSPDGKLEASNRVVINQLTFGERVESPDATKLPVSLAIALLKDRNGVIDLDLPITGSLNDPQFSVFGLVFKVLGNLIVKAVTAPFSLLMGGGSSDAASVAFVPGTEQVTPDGETSLGKVAQALLDRPALTLTVRGGADAQAELDAIRSAKLEAQLLAAHQRRAGVGATPPAPPTAAEREALLRRLYADTRLPDKPRNVLGLAKELPPADMAARLKAAMVVSDEEVRELAVRRGMAVRDALLTKGLPAERLFLAAPQWRAAASTPEAQPPMSGAQLVLSTR